MNAVVEDEVDELLIFVDRPQPSLQPYLVTTRPPSHCLTKKQPLVLKEKNKEDLERERMQQREVYSENVGKMLLPGHWVRPSASFSFVGG